VHRLAGSVSKVLVRKAWIAATYRSRRVTRLSFQHLFSFVYTRCGLALSAPDGLSLGFYRQILREFMASFVEPKPFGTGPSK
jgi:hypothetical protein